MKSEINTNKIKELLNVATSQLSHETLDKLRMARTRAMDRQRIRQSVPVLAWLGGNHSGQNETQHLSKPMLWLIGAVLAASLITGATYWRNYTIEHDIAEVDIAILIDDMPINVFLD
jgi:hypothetical protein